MSKKWHIDWALKFLMKKCHVLTLRTHTINKMLTLRILIINKFHHNKYYPSQPHDYPNYNLQITSFSAGQGSTSFSSSAQYPSSSNKYLPSFQYNTDTITSGGLPPLHPTSAGCSTPTLDSSVPESPVEFGADKRRKKAPPTYDAPWWHYYEQNLGPDCVLINARCNVSNCKTPYNYVIKKLLKSI
jgi:hypothetical protein